MERVKNMEEKYKRADAVITIKGRVYALYNKGTLKNIHIWSISRPVRFQKGSSAPY